VKHQKRPKEAQQLFNIVEKNMDDDNLLSS
jgi:hypothetical protein